MKKIFAIILALAMTFALSAVALAEQTVPTGQGGSGTITLNNATIDATYTLRKIFDATYSEGAASYTTDNATFVGKQSDTDFPFTLTALGNNVYSVTRKTGATDDQILAWLKTNKDIFPMVTTSATTASDVVIKWTGLKPGYYLIESSVSNDAAVTITNAKPDANIVDKNTSAGIDPSEGKKVQDASGNWVDLNSAGIGDTVTFKITANVPKYNGTEQVTSYKFVDKMGNGLDFASITSVIVKEGTQADYKLDAIAEGEAATWNKTYKLTVDSDNHGFTLEFKPSECTGYPANGVVTILYTAKVNENAGTDNCTNEVTMSVNGTEETDKPDTNTNVYGFVVHKVDSDEQPITETAQFSLWTAETGGTQINLVDITPANATVKEYRVATAAEASAENFESAPIVAGVAKVWGLAAGTYYLQEDVEPNGYNRLTERQAVTINGTVCTSTTYPNCLDPVNVKNNKGSELPSVGGIGTTIFYIIGGLLMVGAAVLLVVRKKMSVTE